MFDLKLLQSSYLEIMVTLFLVIQLHVLVIYKHSLEQFFFQYYTLSCFSIIFFIRVYQFQQCFLGSLIHELYFFFLSDALGGNISGLAPGHSCFLILFSGVFISPNFYVISLGICRQKQLLYRDREYNYRQIQALIQSY